ncbi:S-adenosyl-L-methionine-dependent methyltransferase [Phycomyces blakesleeanus]|uniref:S-adenosyl-L-methionine-dependent methyltransferase n=1 Tax=Phycomyces blakesleeanus TaxID=4837 RepID=A0ABR3B7E3_PHYBL
MSDITAVSPSDLDIDTDIDSGFDITNLPESFKRFLKDNDIDPRIYTVTKLPRFVRWNSHLDQSLLPTLDQLREQLKTQDVWKVQGLDGFFGFNLVKNGPRLFDIPAYKDHSLFGIDLSSAVAVEALCIEQDDHVLDVCCAPGAKLCMIANIIGQKGTGTVTGVDLAPHRLATCQSLLKKYRVGERARLFAADGTQFAIPAPSRLGSVVLGDVKLDEARPAKRRKTQKKAGNINPFWAPRMLRFDDMCPSRLYDKVNELPPFIGTL